MKKTACLAMIVVLFALLGCKGKIVANVKAQTTPATTASGPLAPPEDLSGGDRQALLSGFPLDILPLYKCIKVTDCEFETVETDQNFLLGTDVYTLIYTTEASEDEAISFYNQIVIPMGEISYDESLTGQAGDNFADITLSREQGQPLEVMLQIGLTDAQKSESNPYFADYNEAVTALGDGNMLYSRRFRKFYINDKLASQYISSYVCKLSTKKFTSLYEGAYKKQDGFSKAEDRYGKTYHFTLDSKAWSVAITKNTDDNAAVYLTIVCDPQ